MSTKTNQTKQPLKGIPVVPLNQQHQQTSQLYEGQQFDQPKLIHPNRRTQESSVIFVTQQPQNPSLPLAPPPSIASKVSSGPLPGQVPLKSPYGAPLSSSLFQPQPQTYQHQQQIQPNLQQKPIAPPPHPQQIMLMGPPPIRSSVQSQQQQHQPIYHQPPPLPSSNSFIAPGGIILHPQQQMNPQSQYYIPRATVTTGVPPPSSSSSSSYYNQNQTMMRPTAAPQSQFQQAPSAYYQQYMQRQTK